MALRGITLNATSASLQFHSVVVEGIRTLSEAFTWIDVSMGFFSFVLSYCFIADEEFLGLSLL